MLKKLEKVQKEMKWQGKSVGVLGFGISGRESCLFLLEKGADVILYDETEETKLNSEYLDLCKKFEKFREIYYEQGLGAIDYQSFMNLVKSYFDKSMFNYIKTVVPARSKLVEGLMLEPSILERPKLQLKPIFEENVEIPTGSVYNMGYGISGSKNTYYTQSLDIGTTGPSILNDITHVRFNNAPDDYGFGVYSENGVAYYDGEYYRADIIRNKKS